MSRIVATLFAILLLLGVSAASAQTNLALNRPVLASSTENAGTPATAAVDGNAGTRWASAFADPQWIRIDLGTTTSITSVSLNWEAAYAKSFQIQTSNDAMTWTTVYTTTTGAGGNVTLNVSGSGRYIRMYGTMRATGYGYSLWEFQVFGGGSGTPTATATTRATPTPTTRPRATATATATTPRATATATTASTTNLALSRPCTASSALQACANAFDGNATGTRWESAQGVDPQWVFVDLGSSASISRVVLRWETAAGKSYQIQTSSDAATWTNIFTTTTGDGAVDDLAVTGSGRYVRMYGTARTTGWGYSLWEFEVYGGGGAATPTSTARPTATSTARATATSTARATATPTPTATATSGGGSSLISQNRACVASSIENAGSGCSFAFDGNLTATRWSSLATDPQWIYMDLGGTASINKVVLTWEAAYGKAYQIQTSGDAVNWTAIYSTTTGAGGTETLNITGSGRYVRMYGTARGTGYGYSLWEFQVYGSGGAPTPTPSPVSNFWGDTSTIPPAANVMMFKFINKTNGHYADNQIYWSFNGIVHTIAEQPYFDMPANSSGRMYFGLGANANPANPLAYWDFIEFTIGPTVFNGNTTRVDSFGLKIAMRMHCADGFDVAVGENEATFAEDRAVTFQRYVNAVPTEFKACGTVQAPYRIPEPGGGCGFNAGGQYATYYDSYINSIWANNGITIPKPGPNGSGLGDYPDLSAAIFRHVGAAAGTFDSAGHLLSQQLWSNPATFYQAAPAHYYAKFMHDIAINGLSYGFPYDDVGGYSSYISHDNPQWMVVAIGW